MFRIIPPNKCWSKIGATFLIDVALGGVYICWPRKTMPDAERLGGGFDGRRAEVGGKSCNFRAPQGCSGTHPVGRALHVRENMHYNACWGRNVAKSAL